MTWVGQRVRFAPNPGKPELVVEATVERQRDDPRLGPHTKPRAGMQGWLDTRDHAGAFRSVRPGRCEVLPMPSRQS